jgi:hypothetical protein
MSYETEKAQEIRMVIKWIFYITIATAIYISLKFINEREITLPEVTNDLTEDTVKVTTEVTSRAVEEGVIVSLDVMDKSTHITKDLLSKSISMTKQLIIKNIDDMNNPKKQSAAVAPTTTSQSKSVDRTAHDVDDEDFEPEPRKYKYPLF